MIRDILELAGYKPAEQVAAVGAGLKRYGRSVAGSNYVIGKTGK